MHGMTKAIMNSAVLLLRPVESFRMEQVPKFRSYPKTPGNEIAQKKSWKKKRNSQLVRRLTPNAEKSGQLHSIGEYPTESNHRSNPLLAIDFRIRTVMRYHDVPAIEGKKSMRTLDTSHAHMTYSRTYLLWSLQCTAARRQRCHTEWTESCCTGNLHASTCLWWIETHWMAALAHRTNSRQCTNCSATKFETLDIDLIREWIQWKSPDDECCGHISHFRTFQQSNDR